MSTLTELGAPILGPKYFYRVHPPQGIFEKVRVEIRERKRFFSCRRAYGTAFFGPIWQSKTYEEAVIEAASRAYNDLLESRIEKENRKHPLVGDHEGGFDPTVLTQPCTHMSITERP